MSLILSSGRIGNVDIKNRIVMPPMCTYASDDNATVGDFHLNHYAARALGGVGLIIVEATAVEGRGRISDKDFGLYNDSQIDGHKRLNEICHAYGAKTAIQLAHAGRKSCAQASTPIAPSAIKFSNEEGYKTPLEMGLDDINALKNSFIQSAIRARSAGYDIVELHAAHGYLLNEFLSPLTNLRDDTYGGSLENRCRLVCEIAVGIIEIVGIPLIVRISADEWHEHGWCIQDSINLSIKLKKLGVDAIHVSAGGNQAHPSNPPKFEPLYQVGYSKAIKNGAEISTIAVGLITSPAEGESVLREESCDFVAYGRELLRNPNLAFYAAKEYGQLDTVCSSYIRAFS